ncbi:MAG: patatin-like phospholipase family protein, partial [Pseudomonadales bacterium]|nr:patatin-like phospholipase family protein [Pseudomonadales bacterium]
MSNPLIIHAGRAVRERILRDGFRYDDFDVVLGAAGGPKWLVLYGLDAVLAPALAASPRPRSFIGASVGAWRLAAYLQTDPQGALDRLLARYRDPAFFAEARPDMTARFEADVSAVLGQAGLEALAQGAPNALYAVITAFGAGRRNLPWRLALT